ncbi:MAG: YkgJ family cysteine cluster protein [Pseudomonadota bacterium]
MNAEMTPIDMDEPFQFSCSKSVPCFNECCRDLNQFLTPYDILRLKTGLGMKSTDFLKEYTLQHTGPASGLPVVTLKPANQKDLVCPFVTDDGCRVYPDRPGSCRMYPLARMISRSRETGKVTEHWALIREPHCQGFQQNIRMTVREWIQTQKLLEYNEMNDRLMEIISLKNQRKPGSLDVKSRHLFHMVCYDLDNFKSHIFEKGILNGLNMDSNQMESLQDDTTLLKFGLIWLKEALF